MMAAERRAFLCMSMKISPSVPSSYSPVRRNNLCPADARLLGEAVAARRQAAAAELGRRWRPRLLHRRERLAELLPSRYSATALSPSFHDSV